MLSGMALNPKNLSTLSQEFSGIDAIACMSLYATPLLSRQNILTAEKIHQLQWQGVCQLAGYSREEGRVDIQHQM